MVLSSTKHENCYWGCCLRPHLVLLQPLLQKRSWGDELPLGIVVQLPQK